MLLAFGKTSNDQQNSKIVFVDPIYQRQFIGLPTLPLKENLHIFPIANTIVVCGTSEVGNHEECLCYDDNTNQVWLWMKQKLQFSRKYASTQVLTFKNHAGEIVTQLWILGGAIMQTSTVASVIQSADFLTLDIDDQVNGFNCFTKINENWKSGVDMPKALADHCTVVVDEHKILVSGGFTIEDFVVKDTGFYDVLDGSWENLESMKQARKQHTCAKLDLSAGFEVAIIAGGQDASNEPLSSCEIFYLKKEIQQWAEIQSLPLPLTMSSLINVNNRLILSGGMSSGIAQNAMWVYDEENGWHYFNQKLSLGLYSHISVLWEKKPNTIIKGNPHY